MSAKRALRDEKFLDLQLWGGWRAIRKLSAAIKARESGGPRAEFDHNIETFSPLNEGALPREGLPGNIILPIRQGDASSDIDDWRHSHMSVLASAAANRRRHFSDRHFKPLRQMQDLARAVIEDGSQLFPERAVFVPPEIDGENTIPSTKEQR